MVMNQTKRILIVVVVLFVIIGVILMVDFLQRQNAASQLPADMPPGSIPIYINSEFIASFVPEDLNQLDVVSFTDDEEGKTQEGYLLRDVILLYIDDSNLAVDTELTVSSSSREKVKSLSWGEIDNLENMVMFDISGRGTLKLVSKIPGFDIRDAWIQDVDKIEITIP
jgi:hypothetical protein